MNRYDISSKLVHLTKGTWQQAAVTFQSIIDEKRLRGGTGEINDDLRCVCFSEAPISSLSVILADPSQHGFRYAPFGVMIDKHWLFEQGGRPVIYQAEEEYELLHRKQRYRHKRYEPAKGIDFTWEREWRIQIDELDLDSKQTTLVVPNRKWEEQILSARYGSISRSAMVTRGFMSRSMVENEWHLIVLEDLGVRLPKDNAK